MAQSPIIFIVNSKQIIRVLIKATNLQTALDIASMIMSAVKKKIVPA